MKFVSDSNLSRFLSKIKSWLGVSLYTETTANPFNSSAQNLVMKCFKIFNLKVIYFSVSVNNAVQAGKVNFDEAFAETPSVWVYKNNDSSGYTVQPQNYCASSPSYIQFNIQPITGAGTTLVISYLVIGRMSV